MTIGFKTASGLRRYAWACPYTVMGITLGFLLGLTPRRFSGALVFEGSGSLLRGFLPHAALTLGHAVLALEPIPAQVLAHELVHVRQYERWGPFSLPAWLAGLVIGALLTGHPYLGNPLEQEAFSKGEGLNPVSGLCPECGQPLSRHLPK